MRIRIINGPNLNKLGTREPQIYGNLSYEELKKNLEAYGIEHKVQIEVLQSNHEGQLIDWLQQTDAFDKLIINPAAYSHTSVAVLDALYNLKCPKIEVHISNVHSRESFRSKLITTKGVDGVIAGLGTDGYFTAVDYLIKK